MVAVTGLAGETEAGCSNPAQRSFAPNPKFEYNQFFGFLPAPVLLLVFQHETGLLFVQQCLD